MNIQDMNLADWTAVLLAPVTVTGAVVAALAWRTSAGVRRDQADAEQKRRHREMRPELHLALDMKWPPEAGLLVVKLMGPRDVERYDRIRVEVRDDGKNRQPRHDVTAEQIRLQVWGPFRLRPGTDGADHDGRAAEQDDQAVTDSWLFTVERTTPPAWYSGGDSAWRSDYADEPLRFRIEVGLGDQSWVEMQEVPQPQRSAYEDGGLTVV
ncbi:hypothetical protein OG598_12100 [Micromonospora sp. NBC_00330]|uniref:hypothetical protein n=1 Tax=Micromonospora sp. NBC_00330 TaxID=2903585 RepID=UPI002E29A645|nr:hypothetical protein [Micromonospora sp. NBC_00330]